VGILLQVPLEIRLRERECALALVKPVADSCERGNETFGTKTSDITTNITRNWAPCYGTRILAEAYCLNPALLWVSSLSLYLFQHSLTSALLRMSGRYGTRPETNASDSKPRSSLALEMAGVTVHQLHWLSRRLNSARVLSLLIHTVRSRVSEEFTFRS
jgi:hypothetical protein